MNFKDYPETEDTLRDIAALRDILKKIQQNSDDKDIPTISLLTEANIKLDQIEESVKGYENDLGWSTSYR